MIVQRQAMVAAIVLFALSSAAAQKRDLGILGKNAPTWSISQWANLPADKTSLEIFDFRGKVLYLYCFQSWCPGCQSHGFPTLKQVSAEFAENPEVRFVAIQTVFEGFGANSFQNGISTVKKFGLDIPVGHSGGEANRSVLMAGYRTGGTPWTIIIDKNGIVRFNDFHADAASATKLINTLLAEKPEKADIQMIPEPREAVDMLGRRLDLSKLQSLDSNKNLVDDLSGKVSLVRWWTDSCPFCEVSLPAIESLRDNFPNERFQTLAIYHPKPVRPVDNNKIVATARSYGYTGSLAIDIDWSVLRKIYLDLAPRSATSVSFILDEKGIVRYVHPGPEFCAIDSPDKATEYRDYQEIRKVIKLLIAESSQEE